jgi:hypothetical protein
MNLKPAMALWTIFVLGNITLVGCASTPTPPQDNLIKGVLLEVDTKSYTNCWRCLKFEGGFQCLVRAQYAEQWYIGHYQEITVNDAGEFVSNKCDSYDDLLPGFKEQVYVLPEKAPEVPSLANKDE